MSAMLGDNGGGSSDKCDSGWTSYLQHSSYSYYSHPPPPSCNNNCRDNKSYRIKKVVSRVGVHEINNAGRYSDREVEAEEEEDDDEDLSMVSDASSGPPHFDLNNVVGDRNNGQYIGSRKYEFEHRCEAKDFAHLDDTASSPLFFSPKKKNNGGGIHCNVEEGSSSLESLIDYSNSPALSATHSQERTRSLQESYHQYFPSPYSADRFQQNQWS